MGAPSSAEVAEALRRSLTERFGDEVTVVGEPSSNGLGFDSAIHFVQFRGSALPSAWTGPLVVRIKPTAEAIDVARHEQALQTWLRAAGYPVPTVLEVFAPGELTDLPTQVMERAPGVMMIDAVKRAPWTTSRRVDDLAALHVRLHALPTDGFPASMDLVDRRLRLPRAVAETLGDVDLRRGLEQVEALAARLRSAPGVVCHGDFHPLNVIVDAATDDVVNESASTVIDWSDAGIGDLHGDVARTQLLFEIAWITGNSRVERALLRAAAPRIGRRYLRAYAAEAAQRGFSLDEARLRLWRPAHLVHGWAQVLAARAGSFDGAADRVPDSLADDLRQRFDAAIDEV